jgi:hypothetical protein
MEAEPAADFAPAEPKFSEECGFASLLAEFAAPPAIRHHAETSATMIAGIDGPGPAVSDRGGAAVVENRLGCAMTGPDRCVDDTAECRQAGRKKANNSHDRGPFDRLPTCERACIGHHAHGQMFSCRRDDMLEGGLRRVLNFLGDFLKIVNGPCAGAAADAPDPAATSEAAASPSTNQKFASVKPTGRVSEARRRKVDLCRVWHPADQCRPHKFHPKSGRASWLLSAIRCLRDYPGQPVISPHVFVKSARRLPVGCGSRAHDVSRGSPATSLNENASTRV